MAQHNHALNTYILGGEKNVIKTLTCLSLLLSHVMVTDIGCVLYTGLNGRAGVILYP